MKTVGGLGLDSLRVKKVLMRTFFLDMRGESDRRLLAKKGSHENKRRLYGKSTANAERFCEGS